MAAVEQRVDEYVFRYTTEGVDQTKAKVDALGASLDKLTTSQDKSAASNDKGSTASDRATRAAAMREAVAAKAQRQLDQEARALAQVQQAQDAAAASTNGLTAAQEKAVTSYAAAQKAANDNSAAIGKQTSVYAEVGKAAAAHPVLVLAASVAAARALAGLATSAAGYLGSASASVATFAEGSTAMGGAVASGGTVAARGLALAGEALGAVAGYLLTYAAKVEGASSVTGLLFGALRLIPASILPIAAAFAAFQVASAVIGKAYDDLQKLIDLGQRAQSLDVGAPFLKSFEAAGKAIGATSEQMDQALQHAASFLKDTWGQDNNNLSKLLNSITATGVAGANGLQSTALADTATTFEERLKAGLAAMKELDALGLHLASIDVGTKVLGPETVERMRVTGTSAEQLSAALQAAAEKEVLKQEQVDRALQLNKNIADTKQAISDAWAVNLDFSAAATLLDGIWLRILQTVLSIVQAINGAIDGVVAFGATVTSAIGGAFSAVAGQVSGLLSQLGIISKQSEQEITEAVDPSKLNGPFLPTITGRDLGYVSTVVDNRKPDPAPARQAKQAAQDATSSYDSLIQRTKDHIEEMDLETRSVGMNTDAVIKMKLAHDLQRAAEKSGIDVTDAMRQKWDGLGTSVAASTDALAKAKRGLELTKEAQRELSDDFSTFADDVVLGGKKIGEAFADLSKTFASSSLKALLTGKGGLAALFGTAGEESGDIGGLLGGKLSLNGVLGTDLAARAPLAGAQGPTMEASGLGSIFDTDKIADSLGLGAESGLGKAVTSWLKESKAGGGIISSPLGQGLAAVGAGASVGYSSQSPIMGALSGGLAGLATGNPVLAIAGAGAGAIGSIPSSKKDRRHVARQRLRDLA
ncbi:hypothetical protein [Methylobacterium sp. GC_Met_2]|uniref:hypothetical protein n=1 Tax=Methylobacterium sp. GC_Met_2 TaxID=2937376 RepID=UPI00226B49BC|nr:hypothetical protein [Methylobacterium sp. GC_Met_2]